LGGIEYMARAFAIEDGSLTTSKIVASTTRQYKDIDLLFHVNNVGNIYKKVDAAAVKQSVKNIITTEFGEKPFNPDFGAGLSTELFELFTPNTVYDLDLKIRSAINIWEPRAKVEDIRIRELTEQNALYITLRFKVVNVEELVTLNVTLSRLR